MIVLREITYLSIVLRIALAALMGGIFGWEREMKNRAAGLRTYMLVCVGSCMIMLTNQYIYPVFAAGDPVRMGAQVISGIGFLGAGTIVVTKNNQIRGLTTAAGLWSVAAVGLALGIGFYEAALVGSFAIFTVMTLLQKMDNRMHRRTKTVEVYMEVASTVTLGELLRSIRESDYEVQDVQRDSSLETDSNGNRAYIALLKDQKRCNHIEIVERLRQMPGVA